jgi:hypothetical protein
MLSLDEKTIRQSFINTTRKEVTDLTLPSGFAAIDWSRLDYFGWRDPKLPRRAYIVVTLDDGAVGISLTRAATSPRSRAQCSWCQDVTLPNDVALFSARRAGAPGRNGDTVGILVCDEFQCSTNVRKLPPMAYIGFDAEAARVQRIAVLRDRAATFAAGMMAAG